MVKPKHFNYNKETANNNYFQMCDDIVNNESDRLINIYPPDPVRYTELLRNIFQNICI